MKDVLDFVNSFRGPARSAVSGSRQPERTTPSHAAEADAPWTGC